MKRNTRILAVLSIAGFLTAVPVAQADQTETPKETYGEIFTRKIGSSLANLSTATLEIPKNIIIDLNTPGSNVIYGFIGGTMLGVIHTMGRMATGILDLVTAPIPTYPSIYPLYIWDDFDALTAYGPVLRLEETQ